MNLSAKVDNALNGLLSFQINKYNASAVSQPTALYLHRTLTWKGGQGIFQQPTPDLAKDTQTS